MDRQQKHSEPSGSQTPEWRKTHSPHSTTQHNTEANNATLRQSNERTHTSQPAQSGRGAANTAHPFAFIMYGAPSDSTTQARKREVRSEAAKRSAERRRNTMEQRRSEQRGRRDTSVRRKKAEASRQASSPAQPHAASTPSVSRESSQNDTGESARPTSQSSHRQTAAPQREVSVQASGRFRQYEEATPEAPKLPSLAEILRPSRPR
ncbi:hypothetical protein KC340_g5986 [Hortaea werneckii]|nr:hypothetical protein KC342_g13512 [Hortaea werneckii]KAI7099465.1 hypothetical protein KC339_g8184 [Hortaea werneckii]KAI7227524.1 hypothetical protein KC365_g8860 [Hortaea werneckii]KAI7325911.1 hypothetical protein KC340_g5986 [Hortaea werneckii]KAI7392474.1 hypothetical protein KC328_g7031 [Hortaea werneckii]